MGWGQHSAQSNSRRLADAVRVFLAHGTTGNMERMALALDEFDSDEPAPPAAY